MKVTLKGIRYNLGNYFLAGMAFSLIWLIYSSTLLFYSSSQSFAESSDATRLELERALKDNDLVKIKQTLWKTKGPNIQRVEFVPNNEFSIIHPSLVVGAYSEFKLLEIQKPYSVVVNGFTLGEAKTYINLLDLLRSSFWGNMDVFSFMSVLFVGIIIFSNRRTAKALANIEKRMSLAKDGDLDSLEKSLSEISEKSWSSISGFKEFIYNHLRLSEEKIALDQEMNEFEYRYKLAREVAHGIKSPVHSLNVLKKKISDKLDDNHKKLLDMSLERINFHANGLLTENAKEEKQRKVNVSKAVSKLIALKRNEFSKFQDIEIKYEDKTNASLSLPWQSIYEILSNLLNNAFDAIENESGEIRVITRIEGQSFVIECADTGFGIPQKVIEKIWDTNFSFEKKHGSGIGLSSMREVVEKKWRGSCNVFSKEGIGTKFELRIPCNLST